MIDENKLNADFQVLTSTYSELLAKGLTYLKEVQDYLTSKNITVSAQSNYIQFKITGITFKTVLEVSNDLNSIAFRTGYLSLYESSIVNNMEQRKKEVEFPFDLKTPNINNMPLPEFKKHFLSFVIKNIERRDGKLSLEP